jgi:serine/threonine protein kinase
MQLTHAQLELEKVLCNRYCLKQKLGQNTVRQTWLARDLQAIDSQNSQVVVKLLCFGGYTQWEQLKLFEGEARVLKQLNYPGIPQYRNYFYIDDRCLWFGFVEDYIAGNSLAGLLNEGKKFVEQEIRQIAIDLLNILIYLHELHPPVLHKNIKPSNLIWDRNKRLYLVDFGTAQDKVTPAGGAFTVVGTYGYTPIEQFGNKAVAASDLYALGATLIHLLTGIAPGDLPQKDLRIQFRDRTYITPNLANWIEKLTEPDLTKRFSSAREAMKSLMSDIFLSSERLEKNNSLPQPQPAKVEKPAYTCVKLISTDRELKVQIPMRKINDLNDGFRTIACIAFFVLLCMAFFIKSQTFTILFLVFLFAPFGIPAILLIGFISRSIGYLFASSAIVLNRERTEVKKKILGLTYRRFKILTQSIKGVSISPTDRFSQSLSITITSSSKLTQNMRCSFGSHLSEAELVWLVAEIRQWLQTAQNAMNR